MIEQSMFRIQANKKNKILNEDLYINKVSSPNYV